MKREGLYTNVVVGSTTRERDVSIELLSIILEINEISSIDIYGDF